MFSEMCCPQCKKALNGASNRLVRDSCGHQKCRVCLLLDEEKCQQCNNESTSKESVIKYDHSGVITYSGAVTNCSKLTNTPLNGVENSIVSVKDESEEPPITATKQKSSKTKSTSKRSYRSIIIPNHVSIMKNPLQYKCNICNKQFGTKSHIKYHLYCSGVAKPYRCVQCSKEFITKTTLDVHMLKHGDKKPFVCKICEKSFRERSKLKRHSILHTSNKPFVCSECGKAFRGKESLKIHTLIHRNEKPFKCKICNAAFNNTSNLNSHLISHSKEKTHMCEQCSKKFKFKWALTVHRRSHLRIRPYECNVCTKAFVNNKDLQRHQLIHLDTKAFTCSICLTSFRRKDNLYRHVKNTHPGKTADPVSSTVKQLIDKQQQKQQQKTIVDNPNAIHVITASPACTKNLQETSLVKPVENRSGTVINGPLKLAFKTSAFKSNYNINRNFDYEPPKVYDMAESVNICQKILSPASPLKTNNNNNVINESTSTEICQKILSPYSSGPIQTSFEHKTHAIIKNIKFKLPSNYANLKANDSLNDLVPLKPVNVNLTNEFINSNNNNNSTFAELKAVTKAATSVIVNTNPTVNNNMHWRRRTSQNLTSRILEN